MTKANPGGGGPSEKSDPSRRGSSAGHASATSVSRGDDSSPDLKSAKEATEEAVVQAKRQVRQFAGEAKENLRSIATRQKDRSADRIGIVGHAFRQAARNLDDDGQPTMARYADQAGDGLERLSEQLRDRDIDAIVGAAEDFARRQPALFLGCAVGSGFLLARFLKSSAERREAGEFQRPVYQVHGSNPATAGSAAATSKGGEP